MSVDHVLEAYSRIECITDTVCLNTNIIATASTKMYAVIKFIYPSHHIKGRAPDYMYVWYVLLATRP